MDGVKQVISQFDKNELKTEQFDTSKLETKPFINNDSNKGTQFSKDDSNSKVIVSEPTAPSDEFEPMPIRESEQNGDHGECSDGDQDNSKESFRNAANQINL